MRDYVLDQAEFRQKTGGLSGLTRRLKNWRARRAIKQLQAIDEAALLTLGITRESLHQLAQRPLSLDLDWEAERAARLNSVDTLRPNS